MCELISFSFSVVLCMRALFAFWVNGYVCIMSCMLVCFCVCVCMGMYMCIYVYVCLCIFILCYSDVDLIVGSKPGNRRPGFVFVVNPIYWRFEDRPMR